MSQTLFKKELFIPSTFEGLNKCLDIVGEVREQFDLDFDTSFGLHTIMVESIENAFIHGNKGVRELEVRVFISICANEILVEVEDTGDGFDLNSIESPLVGSNIKNEGGRGIFFIKMLSSTCYTVGRGNIIRIKLKR
ncbi:MAG: ATP-binding protein [Bacteroidia bacterium]|nr:ATP-binding protein [Bacteroidia bacterium]